MPSKPLAAAWRICRSVVGETLPETTASRSTVPGSGKDAALSADARLPPGGEQRIFDAGGAGDEAAARSAAMPPELAAGRACCVSALSTSNSSDAARRLASAVEPPIGIGRADSTARSTSR